jgi:hypothetical protein
MRIVWIPILQSERELELSRYYGPYNGRSSSGGVVIREGHVSSSAPPRVKKEAPVKDELEEKPALEEDERLWWVKEIALADATRREQAGTPPAAGEVVLRGPVNG